MEYRKLGASGLHVSTIGFGCMSLRPEASSERLIVEAIEGGINFLDTADLYDKGENEQLVGRALKGKRDKVILATKVGNQWRENGSGWDWNPSKAYIISSVEKSLQRLDTDHIDLYQLHGGTLDDPIDEAIEAFEQLKAAGKIRYYGISSIRPNVIREWVSRSSAVSVMMQYSLLDRRPEETAFPLLEQKGAGVLARGGLAQGLLTGKPPKAYLGYSEADVKQVSDKVLAMSGNGRTAAAIALQFVLAQPVVSSAVVGIRTPEQLRDALAAADAALSDEETQTLRSILTPNVYSDHR